MAGRGPLMRERANDIAFAFHEPDKVKELHPKALQPSTAVKWWGGGE